MSIVLSEIIKTYNKGKETENTVIKGISLTIENGEFVAVKGKSGAGKSTLLHMIGCLDECTEGKYILDGIDISKLSNGELAELRNRKFGFILQDFGLLNDETVLQNVMLPMMFNKTRFGQMKKTARNCLALFNMEKMLDREVGTLSGGEKQRVAVARALVNDPDYILADEPTGALDSANSENLIEELKRLYEMGKTVIIITHDDSIAARCNRVITIKDGTLYEDTTV